MAELPALDGKMLGRGANVPRVGTFCYIRSASVGEWARNRVMPRALLALVVGAVVGAAVTYFTPAARFAPAGDAGVAPGDPHAEAAPKLEASRAPASLTRTADRAALYREAADADSAALARLISAAVALPPSRARTDRLGVLLARYAGTDADRAVAIARELGLGTSTLAALYAQWAAADPAGALAALGDVQSPAAATAIGLAVLQALGDD